MATQHAQSDANSGQSGEQKPAPYLRRMVITLGPLEEWRGKSAGETVRFEANGTHNGLKVTATIHKTVMGQPQPSEICIYNLAPDTRAAVRNGLTRITLQAGWENFDLHTVFQGSVFSAVSERNGTDIVLKISALPGYGALLRGITSRSFAGGTPVKSVVKALAADLPGLCVEDGGIEGIEGRIGPGGWCFAGSTRDGLTRLAQEYGFSWHIEAGAFKAVSDKAAFHGTLTLNGENGGLISITPSLSGPKQKKSGIKIKAMYVPGISAGSCVDVKSTVMPRLNGRYRIHTAAIHLDSHGEAWSMDIDANAGNAGGKA